MPLEDISFMMLNPSAADANHVRSLMVQPNAIFVDHTPGGAQFPGVRERLDRMAAEAGYLKTVIGIVRDRNQRPRFEIARYTESGAAP